MTETTFATEEWAARLGVSLETIAPAATYSVSLEAGYVSHLTYDEFRALQMKADREPAVRDAVASGYASLSCDAEEQRAILREHPEVKELLKDPRGNEGMLLVKPGSTSRSTTRTDTNGFVLHLVAQAVKTSGADAATGLHRFLADGRDRKLEAREYVVIYGLRLADRIPLGDGAYLAPLDDRFIAQEQFSEEDGQKLRTFGVAGRAFREGSGGSTVFVRDLEWGPGLVPLSTDLDSDFVTVAPRFACDAETFIDLLSIASHRPLVISARLVRLPKWMHEIDPNLSFGMWEGEGFVHDGWWKEAELSGEAAARFKELVVGWVGSEFDPDRERGALRLAVRRLSGSFGRTGRMQWQDRILDYAIALEILYRLDSSELTYKLATRAACFLERQAEKRLAIFEKITDFYGIRSAIMHGSPRRNHRSLGHEDFERACTDGQDLACDTLSEVLRRGRFPDWKQVIFDVKDETAPPPQLDAGHRSGR